MGLPASARLAGFSLRLIRRLPELLFPQSFLQRLLQAVAVVLALVERGQDAAANPEREVDVREEPHYSSS